MPGRWSLTLCCLLLVGFRIHVVSECPASRPCICLNGIIDCSGHGLSNISYMLYQQSDIFHTLTYSNNILTSIQPSVFANLNITRLILSHNSISVITQAAFNGIEGILTELNLAHNRLKKLPVSIGYLRSLHILDVSHNPLDGERSGLRPRDMVDDFSEDIMRELGDTLTTLTFGDEISLSHWPKSLHHMIQLRELYLTGSSIQYMRTGWFHGFEQTLKVLQIKDYRLFQIPVDIGDLTRLTELYIENNRYEDGDSILVEPPFLGIADTLETLALKYDNLTVFPEVIKHLRSLQNLSLEGNSLVFISDESVRYMQNTALKYFSLKNCGLKRIPGAISELKHLLELDLSGNLIRTIEAPDIVHMPTLQTVSFSRNPIKYISRSAFRGLSSLTLLDMSSSDITVLPQSIQNIRHLKILDLTDSQVDCTCDLYWVKRWMNIYEKNVTFLGDCETIQESVESYINYRIPTCRQYVNP